MDPILRAGRNESWKLVTSEDPKPGSSRDINNPDQPQKKCERQEVDIKDTEVKDEHVGPKLGTRRNKPGTGEDPKPGSSRDIDNPDQPRKKFKKQQDAEVKNEHVIVLSFKTINDLPDEMLIEIFRHLSVPDRLKAQEVCCKWHKFAKSEDLWRSVRLSDLSPSRLFEMVPFFPPCMLHLEYIAKEDCSYLLPLRLKQLIEKLRQQCPSLKSLILQNVLVAVHYGSMSFAERSYVRWLLGAKRNVVEQTKACIAKLEFLSDEDEEAESSSDFEILSSDEGEEAPSIPDLEILSNDEDEEAALEIPDLEMISLNISFV